MGLEAGHRTNGLRNSSPVDATHALHENFSVWSKRSLAGHHYWHVFERMFLVHRRNSFCPNSHFSFSTGCECQLGNVAELASQWWRRLMIIEHLRHKAWRLTVQDVLRPDWALSVGTSTFLKMWTTEVQYCHSVSPLVQLLQSSSFCRFRSVRQVRPNGETRLSRRTRRHTYRPHLWFIYRQPLWPCTKHPFLLLLMRCPE